MPVESVSQITATTPYTPREIRRGMRLIPTAFAFASAFQAITTGAVFTSFLAKFLQVSDFWYGLILAAAQAAVFMQFFGSLTVERAGAVKAKYIHYSLPQRLLWLVIAVVPLLAFPQADLRIKLVLALVCCSSVFQNLGTGGVMVWFCAFVPQREMGRFFGFRQRMGMTGMLVVAVGAAFLLDRFSGQGWIYAALFALATVLGLLDLVLMQLIPEHPRPVGDVLPTLREVVVTPWQDAFSRSYLIYAFLAAMVTASMDPFVLKYGFAARETGGLGLSVSLANLLLFILPTLVLAWGAPHWGHVIDRHGPRPVLTLCMIGLIVLPCGWLFMRPAWLWAIPALTLCTALFTSGAAQVEVFMRAQGFPMHRRTCYLAMLNVVIGVAAMLGATFGGLMATFWQHHRPAQLPAWASHYHLLFLTAILLRLLLFAGVMLRLPLPGHGAPREIFRRLAHSGLGR